MKLSDFERHIDSTILSRGENYYLSGCVDDIEEIDHGIWQADVFGTDNYQVRLHLKNDNEISSTGCDCPYDWGPICKHEVAALFALREQKSGKMAGKKAGVVKTNAYSPRPIISGTCTTVVAAMSVRSNPAKNSEK